MLSVIKVLATIIICKLQTIRVIGRISSSQFQLPILSHPAERVPLPQELHLVGHRWWAFPTVVPALWNLLPPDSTLLSFQRSSKPGYINRLGDWAGEGELLKWLCYFKHPFVYYSLFYLGFYTFQCIY